MKALVITPTTGSEDVKDAVRSVSKQDIPVDHLLVCDGKKFENDVRNIQEQVLKFNPSVEVCYLPYNTGGGGYYGHRVMAAFSHLVNHDYVLFLDQDNWYDSEHVSSLIETIESKDLDWAYSLRMIYDKEKNYICDDNCESLGKWPTWVDKNSYLIDSSSYCFKTEFLRKVGHLWDWGWGADRRFYTIVKDKLQSKYDCTGKYTLAYRLGGNEGSVTKEFFIEGNRKIWDKYSGIGNYPWVRQYS